MFVPPLGADASEEDLQVVQGEAKVRNGRVAVQKVPPSPTKLWKIDGPPWLPWYNYTNLVGFMV